MKVTKILVNNFSYKGHTYVLAKNEAGIHIAIDRKYINSDGELTQTLNGLQTFARVEPELNTLEALMQRVREHLDLEEYVATAAEKAHITVEQLKADSKKLGQVTLDFFMGIETVKEVN